MALIHNWWSLLVRLTHPEARREAITSRPWLMTCVGRKTEYAGQTTVTLTGLHGHFAPARAALTRVSALLQGWVAETAEQLTQPSVWHPVGDHLKRILAGIGSPPSQPLLKKTMRMGSAGCGSRLISRPTMIVLPAPGSSARGKRSGWRGSMVSWRR